ncbi:MAG: hypothetical protein K0M56_04045 [Kaistella sp.]|nr:hypothetical protein [Kaistella sp.]
MIKLNNKFDFNVNNNGFSLFIFDIEEGITLSSSLKEVESFLRPEKSDYLRPLFNLNQIDLSILKFIKGNEIYAYLDGYSDGEGWGDDRNDFKQLIGEFQKYKHLITGEIYLLNKDLFDKNDSILKFEEYISYGYYIILIWIFSEHLYICEFTND